MAILLTANLHAVSSSSPGRRCKYTGQSVRPVPIRILSVGKKRSPGVQLMVDDYIDKLKHYCAVEDIQVRSNPKNAKDVKAQVDDEDIAVMSLIRPEEWVVMLDERGRDIGSEEMANLIGDGANKGVSKISFCVGGPYGHGQKLRERADKSIKLSSLVLNHQIALVVLMEQLYRLKIPQKTVCKEFALWLSDKKVLDNYQGAKVPPLAVMRLGGSAFRAMSNLGFSFLCLWPKTSALGLFLQFRALRRQKSSNICSGFGPLELVFDEARDILQLRTGHHREELLVTCLRHFEETKSYRSLAAEHVG